MSAELQETPEEMEARFLAELRGRVAWQSEQAALLRAATPAAAAPLDPLDVATLRDLVDRHRDSPRAAEWRAFLDELDVLKDRKGRLPEQLERLVRVVLADVLP